MRLPTLAIALCLAAPLAAEAAGQAYRVRSFADLRSADGSGDRTTDGTFWLPHGVYESSTNGYVPQATRLSPEGGTTTFTLDGPRAFSPLALRVAASGIAWVVVPEFSQRTSVLYSLNPETNAVQRITVPFVATTLTLDPLNGAPWVSGTGKIAKLVGTALTTYDVESFEGTSSEIDRDRRIWLAADNGSFRSFAVDSGRLDVYADSAGGMQQMRLDSSGRVWAVKVGQSRLICFTPSIREKVEFPLVLTAANWAGIGAGSGGLIHVVSAYGPHFLTSNPGLMTDGVAVTLVAPTTATLTPAVTAVTTTALTSSRRDERQAFVDRIVYVGYDGGRALATQSGVGFTTLVWSNGGEALTGNGPIQWWQPLGGSEAFTTRAVLPVALTVRPDSATDNFFTEVTLTNVDAATSLDLVYTTAAAEYVVPINLPAAQTRVFPDIVKSLRELGASSLPDSAVGTLAARFRNGKGTMAARVYSRFGGGGPFPQGATTGLGYTSVDPASQLFVGRVTLNGLKATSAYRTNIAVANLCGALGTCPTVSLAAEFYDDATGLRVGEKNVDVPPNQFLQLQTPLQDFGVTGETFSVLLQPYSDSHGFDAYATVVSNVNQDAAFIRATGTTTSTLTLPVVVDAQGAGTRFTSECSVTNVDGTPITADVTYTSAGTGASVKEVLTLDVGRGIRYPNAVDHFRKLDPSRIGPDDFGSIRFAFRAYGRAFASSQTTASNGTGLAFTSIDPYLARASRKKMVIGLTQTDAFRTNLAVVHLGSTTSDSTAPVAVLVTVTGPDGSNVGTPLVQTLEPGRLFQWNKVLELVGAAGTGYTATIERTSGLDAFDAYITVIDNVSQDSTFLRAE